MNFVDPSGLFSDDFFRDSDFSDDFYFGNDINFQFNPDFSFDSNFDNSIQFGPPLQFEEFFGSPGSSSDFLLSDFFGLIPLPPIDNFNLDFSVATFPGFPVGGSSGSQTFESLAAAQGLHLASLKSFGLDTFAGELEASLNNNSLFNSPSSPIDSGGVSRALVGVDLGKVLSQSSEFVFDAVKLFDNSEIAANFQNLRDSGFGPIRAGITAFTASVGERIAGNLLDAFSGRDAAGNRLSTGTRLVRGALGIVDAGTTATGLKAFGGAVKTGFKAATGGISSLFSFLRRNAADTLNGRIVNIPGVGNLDLTNAGVTDFLSRNASRINQKLGDKLGKTGGLPFQISRAGSEQARNAVSNTLGNATDISAAFKNRAGDTVFDVFSSRTGMTVRLRADGVFDTLIPEATSASTHLS